jgi:hypothetical protein
MARIALCAACLAAFDDNTFDGILHLKKRVGEGAMHQHHAPRRHTNFPFCLGNEF